MRQGELLNLAWGDVDRSRGVVLLEVTKSGRRREMPLTMVLRYAHLAPENLRAAVARLDDVLVAAPASSGARRAQEAEALAASKA